MPPKSPPEEVTEYRVVVDFPDGGSIEYDPEPLEEARRTFESERGGQVPPKLQSRTVTYSPWEEISDGA